jgi:uncharacterized Fe-S cluster-containing radical SAM superfamily protein
MNRIKNGVNDYPGYLKEGFEPYDPIQLMRLTEERVCRGEWVDLSRDFPDRYGQFYTPDQVAEQLMANARKRRVGKLRISGGEPTLGKDHLLGVLDRVDRRGFTFILETNGIPLGYDPDYARALAEYQDIHVRVSLKAGNADGFQARTGARGEYWELPFQAVERLMAAGASFHVAAMTDPRLMPAAERRALVRRLRKMGYRDFFEEEACDPYKTSVMRLRAAGFELF